MELSRPKKKGIAKDDVALYNDEGGLTCEKGTTVTPLMFCSFQGVRAGWTSIDGNSHLLRSRAQ